MIETNTILGLFVNVVIKSIGRAVSPTPPKMTKKIYPKKDINATAYMGKLTSYVRVIEEVYFRKNYYIFYYSLAWSRLNIQSSEAGFDWTSYELLACYRNRDISVPEEGIGDEQE